MEEKWSSSELTFTENQRWESVAQRLRCISALLISCILRANKYSLLPKWAGVKFLLLADKPHLRMYRGKKELAISGLEMPKPLSLVFSKENGQEERVWPEPHTTIASFVRAGTEAGADVSCLQVVRVEFYYYWSTVDVPGGIGFRCTTVIQQFSSALLSAHPSQWRYQLPSAAHELITILLTIVPMLYFSFLCFTYSISGSLFFLIPSSTSFTSLPSPSGNTSSFSVFMSLFVFFF